MIKQRLVRLPCFIRYVSLTLKLSSLVPGWSKIERYAKDHFGTGDWDIVVNPPDVRIFLSLCTVIGLTFSKVS